MSKELNIQLLASMIKAKRGEDGLRAIAKQIDISAPTLSRVEQGKLPDVETFIKICKWLDEKPETFVLKNEEFNPKTAVTNKDLIMTHLRADKELSPETVKILMNVIELAYKQVTNDEKS